MRNIPFFKIRTTQFLVALNLWLSGQVSKHWTRKNCSANKRRKTNQNTWKHNLASLYERRNGRVCRTSRTQIYSTQLWALELYCTSFLLFQIFFCLLVVLQIYVLWPESVYNSWLAMALESRAWPAPKNKFKSNSWRVMASVNMSSMTKFPNNNNLRCALTIKFLGQQQPEIRK